MQRRQFVRTLSAAFAVGALPSLAAAQDAAAPAKPAPGKPALAGVKAIVFDTFGTVVDWRSSLIADFTEWGKRRGITANWETLVDDWRAAYSPGMDRVRKGETPWTTLDQLHRQSLEKLVTAQNIVGLTEADLDYLRRGWHRLRPWPDAVAGMQRLRKRYILGPLSNGNVALLTNLARHSQIPWDVIFGSDLWKHYKPDPETYLGVCGLLDIKPEELMLTAAHNYDLGAARKLGLRTAFIARPTEYGPRQKLDFKADSDWDVIAKDMGDLADQLGV